MNEEKEIVSTIIRFGRAQEKLNQILQSTNLFDDLSKHSNKWHSENERESAVLNATRFNLCELYNEINELYEILNPN